MSPPPQENDFNAGTCQLQKKNERELRSKAARFGAYVASRVIVAGDAIFAATTAENAGKADLKNCIAELESREEASCPRSMLDQGPDAIESFKKHDARLAAVEKPEACRRAAVCGTWELPY
jgi:hypothetical protein